MASCLRSRALSAEPSRSSGACGRASRAHHPALHVRSSLVPVRWAPFPSARSAPVCLRLSRLQVRHSLATAAPRCSCAGSSPTRVGRWAGDTVAAPVLLSSPPDDGGLCARRSQRGLARVRLTREFCLTCLRRRTSASRWWDRLHSFQAHDGRAPIRRPRARGGWTRVPRAADLRALFTHARG